MILRQFYTITNAGMLVYDQEVDSKTNSLLEKYQLMYMHSHFHLICVTNLDSLKVVLPRDTNQKCKEDIIMSHIIEFLD